MDLVCGLKEIVVFMYKMPSIFVMRKSRGHFLFVKLFYIAKQNKNLRKYWENMEFSIAFIPKTC